MKLVIMAVVLLGSASSFAFGTYNKEVNDQAAKKGFKNISTYCEATVINGQGAKGNLDVEIREFTNKKGEVISVVSYMINESGAEHYLYTDVIPLSVGKALKSSDVVGKRTEVLMEDDKKVIEYETKGSLRSLLAADGAIQIEEVKLNKETKSYNINSDTYLECDEKI